MPYIRDISGRENPIFRYVRSIHDRRKAAEEGVVFLEGLRLCEDALSFGHHPEYILFSEDKEALALSWSERFCIPSTTLFVRMTKQLFEKLGSTEQPQGIALVLRAPSLNGAVPFHGDDLYLVCENTGDPGNLGTMIRTADAFGFSAVLITSGTVDPFNEKVIRASMGSCFHMPIIKFETIRDLCLQLKSNGVELVASHLEGTPIGDAQVRYPTAILVGNEARGLTDESVSFCDRMLKIPMPGHAESLNASVAAAIFGYAFMRK